MVGFDFAYDANRQGYDVYFGGVPIRPTHALRPGDFGFGSYFVYPRSRSTLGPPIEQSTQAVEEEIGSSPRSPHFFLEPSPCTSPAFEEPIMRYEYDEPIICYEYEEPPRLRPTSKSRTNRRRPFVVRRVDDVVCGHCNTRAFGECPPVRACDRMWWRPGRRRCACGC